MRSRVHHLMKASSVELAVGCLADSQSAKRPAPRIRFCAISWPTERGFEVVSGSLRVACCDLPEVFGGSACWPHLGTATASEQVLGRILGPGPHNGDGFGSSSIKPHNHNDHKWRQRLQQRLPKKADRRGGVSYLRSSLRLVHRQRRPVREYREDSAPAVGSVLEDKLAFTLPRW